MNPLDLKHPEHIFYTKKTLTELENKTKSVSMIQTETKGCVNNVWKTDTHGKNNGQEDWKCSHSPYGPRNLRRHIAYVCFLIQALF